MIDFTDVLLLCLYNHDCLFPDRCDEMAQRKVEPINETSCLIFNWPRFLCTILLCQKSFLKVSSKWLLKNKSDNGKLLLGKTYSGERFRAILALLSHYFPQLYILQSQWYPTIKVFVYKIQVNPIHTILKYGDCYDFMDR